MKFKQIRNAIHQSLLCGDSTIKSRGRHAYFYFMGKYKVLYRTGVMSFFDYPCWELENAGVGYFFKHKPQRGDTVIDAGAFVGHMTVFLAKIVGPEGSVIAFEPDPTNYERLIKNINLNKLDNVTPINSALWNKSGKMSLCLNGLGSRIVENGDSSTDDTIDVSTVRADEILESLGVENIQYVKMDVEGAEEKALEGFGKYLDSPDLKLAIATYHVVNGEITARSVESLFKSRGFNTSTEFDKHLSTYAWKEETD